jgi:5-aminopentanamidase
MLIAALQMQPAPADPARNLATIENAAAAAARFGAALLVAPEMSTTGYAIWEDIPRLAEGRDGPIVTRLSTIAQTHKLAVAAGFPERDGANIYNAAALATPDGGLYVYRKCHLFGAHEKAAFAAAAELSPIVAIGGIRVGLLICYDVEFPEWVRTLALAGAELLIVPTALPRLAAANRVSLSMVPTRAFENHVFIAYADLCGGERGTDYQGGSVIAGPDGEILARAGAGPSLLITGIEPERSRDAGLDPYLADRRPELYRGLVRKE